jgi:glycosyltransferase involved in cell wall biosynthesis
MKLSILVPAFNEEKPIVSTLESIQSAPLAFTEKQWSTEWIVCDNS